MEPYQHDMRKIFWFIDWMRKNDIQMKKDNKK